MCVYNHTDTNKSANVLRCVFSYICSSTQTLCSEHKHIHNDQNRKHLSNVLLAIVCMPFTTGCRSLRYMHVPPIRRHHIQVRIHLHATRHVWKIARTVINLCESKANASSSHVVLQCIWHAHSNDTLCESLSHKYVNMNMWLSLALLLNGSNIGALVLIAEPVILVIATHN